MMTYAMADGFALAQILEPEDVPDDLFATMLAVFFTGLAVMTREAGGHAPEHSEYARHIRKLAAPPLAVLLAALGLAAPANAAPVAVSAANWDLFHQLRRLPPEALRRLPGRQPRRAPLAGLPTPESPFKYTKVFEGVGIPVAGSFDPATKSGSIAGSGTAVRIDNFNAHARAIRIGAFGLKANGGALTVTGRIERARTIFARFGPAKPLLRLKGVHPVESSPYQRKGEDGPDTFVIAVQGRATVLPAFARELTRIRCRGRHIVTSRPIHAGTPFGAVRVQLQPATQGRWVGGALDIEEVRASGYDPVADQDVTVTVTPTAPHAAGRPGDSLGAARRPAHAAAMRGVLQLRARHRGAVGVGGGLVLSVGDQQHHRREPGRRVRELQRFTGPRRHRHARWRPHRRHPRRRHHVRVRRARLRGAADQRVAQQCRRGLRALREDRPALVALDQGLEVPQALARLALGQAAHECAARPLCRAGRAAP